MHLEKKTLSQVEAIGQRLLFVQNRDPYSNTYGCFDRRYWAWKLTDFPEATYQRNVYTIAWLLKNGEEWPLEVRCSMEEAIRAGLEYSIKIQHHDGSFDQAFPNERSFGATAFLLHPLLATLEIAEQSFPGAWVSEIDLALKRSADFLLHHDETHGFISNHLAGAALSLIKASSRWGECYSKKADVIISNILKKQSIEGWFLEYDGADPGYQSLCLYYLAQCQAQRQRPDLEKALNRAVEFLSWFVHPDGTFGGEYGSRRTSVFYAGGLSLMGISNALASAMVKGVLEGQRAGRVISCSDIDMGNLAPLTANTILLAENLGRMVMPIELPWQRNEAFRYFKEAGLFIRIDTEGYTVIGIKSGGVIKIFNKVSRRLVAEDCGYVGILKNGNLVFLYKNFRLFRSNAEQI